MRWYSDMREDDRDMFVSGIVSGIATILIMSVLSYLGVFPIRIDLSFYGRLIHG